jgi:surface antigen
LISSTRGLQAAIVAAAMGGLLTVYGASSARADADRRVANLARPYQAAARIVPTKRPLQCVPFARKASGIQIRGDAWTWWTKAEGIYERGRTPRVGAVLAMKRTRRLRLGHLAVVKQIVDDRVIIVDQANWLNRGRIHLNTAVVDVSRNNDWSAVRVWYTPGKRYGARTYPTHGFIYAEPLVVRLASLDRARAADTAQGDPQGAEAWHMPAYKPSHIRPAAATSPAAPPRKPDPTWSAIRRGYDPLSDDARRS